MNFHIHLALEAFIPQKFHTNFTRQGFHQKN